MSPAPDQTPAVAYGLYSQEPIRTPGGGLIMPDLPPETLSRKAKLARLSESASWAEIVLLDWFKRIAVFGVSAAFDIERFERATQSLWRLTAVAKSIFVLEDNPNKSIPAALQTEVDDLFKTSANFQPASDSQQPPTTPSAEAPVSSLGSRTASSAEAPASQTATPSPTTPSPTTPTDTPVDTPDSSPRSALATPHLTNSAAFQSASPSPRSALATPHLTVCAVPSCPTLSFNSIETYLNRTQADLAEAQRPTPPILSPTPKPAKSQPSPPSPPSLTSLESLTSLPSDSPSPRSALATPPCPTTCVQCAEPFCASRIAVPFHHKPAVLKCDGTCRECSKTRACKFTPAYLRPADFRPG